MLALVSLLQSQYHPSVDPPQYRRWLVIIIYMYDSLYRRFPILPLFRQSRERRYWPFGGGGGSTVAWIVLHLVSLKFTIPQLQGLDNILIKAHHLLYTVYNIAYIYPGHGLMSKLNCRLQLLQGWINRCALKLCNNRDESSSSARHYSCCVHTSPLHVVYTQSPLGMN